MGGYSKRMTLQYKASLAMGNNLYHVIGNFLKFHAVVLWSTLCFGLRASVHIICYQQVWLFTLTFTEFKPLALHTTEEI